jgi:tetratricopeptide (TPR) repeat protein
MADNKNNSTEQHGIENVGQALSKVEQFIEDKKTLIIVITSAVVLIVGIFFLYKKFYVAPMEKEAQEQMFVAEQYFEKDSFNLAINGDGNNWGFLKIIDEYSVTGTANLAHYYAGICFLHIGKFQDAIDQLKKFDGDDKLIAPIALGTTGDAYVELGNKEKGVEYYIKAAEESDNDFTSPIYLMKAGEIYESLNKFSKAVEAYNFIKANYPKSSEGRMIDKYITRAQLLEGKKK